MTTTVGSNTSYQLTIPELSETADIQKAIKLIAYGQDADPTNDADIEPNSIAGYLKALLSSPTFTGTVVLPSTTSIGNVSSTELGYLDGVTSAIQTQFTGKASTTSPAITTSITTASTSFALINTNATTINFAGAATTLNIGNTATAAQTVNMFTASTGASTYNFATGAVGSGTTKTLNIGTGAGTAGTTNINIGGNPSVSTSNVNLNGTTAINGNVAVSNGNITISTQGKQLVLANGNTSTAPLRFAGTTVTNYLNATAGTMEWDGETFIATPNSSSGQAFIATPYHFALQSDTNITTSSTTAFGSAITLGPGSYEFEVQIPFQFTYTGSATALSLGIKGSAVSDGIYFLQEIFSNTGALTNLLLAADLTNEVTSGKVQTNWRQQAAVQSLNTTNLVTEIDSLTTGSRYGVYRAKGWVNVTTQGTFYPAASLTGGGSASIKIGAYAKITPVPQYASGYWASQT